MFSAVAMSLLVLTSPLLPFRRPCTPGSSSSPISAGLSTPVSRLGIGSRCRGPRWSRHRRHRRHRRHNNTSSIGNISQPIICLALLAHPALDRLVVLTLLLALPLATRMSRGRSSTWAGVRLGTSQDKDTRGTAAPSSLRRIHGGFMSCNRVRVIYNQMLTRQWFQERSGGHGSSSGSNSKM
jgi:hypothetical protein